MRRGRVKIVSEMSVARRPTHGSLQDRSSRCHGFAFTAFGAVEHEAGFSGDFVKFGAHAQVVAVAFEAAHHKPAEGAFGRRSGGGGAPRAARSSAASSGATNGPNAFVSNGCPPGRPVDAGGVLAAGALPPSIVSIFWTLISSFGTLQRGFTSKSRWGAAKSSWGGASGRWGGASGSWGGTKCWWGDASGRWGGASGWWGDASCPILRLPTTRFRRPRSRVKVRRNGWKVPQGGRKFSREGA